MDCRLSLLVQRFSVSEYQYYDFRALDRPLMRNEMATLRSIFYAGSNYRHELHELLRMG